MANEFFNAEQLSAERTVTGNCTGGAFGLSFPPPLPQADSSAKAAVVVGQTTAWRKRKTEAA
jgi:hypothetical protein